MAITPDELERQHTLLTAAARFDQLRMRDTLAPAHPDPDDQDTPDPDQPRPLSRDEALELLALGEVLIRKAAYGRQLAVRTARATGASWTQVGAALTVSKQSAWETHQRWLVEQEPAGDEAATGARGGDHHLAARPDRAEGASS
ncbi:hypothetical protein [Plantactinospora sp. B24E8]|uniref:hypothetical protein n=1 Tax=Plantactinospora sp. B24E8 TaxID=3153567 RepID=UPI00325C4808